MTQLYAIGWDRCPGCTPDNCDGCHIPAEVTDEMVERAARAMCAVEDDSPWELSEAELELIDPAQRTPADTGQVPNEDKEWFRRHARAALAAAFNHIDQPEGSS